MEKELKKKYEEAMDKVLYDIRKSITLMNQGKGGIEFGWISINIFRQYLVEVGAYKNTTEALFDGGYDGDVNYTNRRRLLYPIINKLGKKYGLRVDKERSKGIRNLHVTWDEE